MKTIMGLVNFNRVEYTAVVFLYHSSYVKTPHKFVFIDNNSTDGTKEFMRILSEQKEFLASLPFEVEFMPLDKNVGVAGANNALWRKYMDCGNEFFGEVANDTICDFDCLEYLENALNSFPELGAVSINSTITQKPENFKRRNNSLVEYPYDMDTNIMLYRKKAIQETGYINEGRGLIASRVHYCTDLRAKGWQLGNCANRLLKCLLKDSKYEDRFHVNGGPFLLEGLKSLVYTEDYLDCISGKNSEISSNLYDNRVDLGNKEEYARGLVNKIVKIHEMMKKRNMPLNMLVFHEFWEKI